MPSVVLQCIVVTCIASPVSLNIVLAVLVSIDQCPFPRPWQRDLDDSDAMEGDPKYMAPELMSGRFSAAADVFSLGLTLLELACDLELPAGSAGWHQLRSGQVPAPLRRALSPPLRAVLERMLHPDPARRATAAELLRMPAVRAARRKRQLTILCCTAVSNAGVVG